jgi:hypothetical protein
MITGFDVHDPPEAPFTIRRKRCSRSNGISVHVAPERAFPDPVALRFGYRREDRKNQLGDAVAGHIAAKVNHVQAYPRWPPQTWWIFGWRSASDRQDDLGSVTEHALYRVFASELLKSVRMMRIISAACHDVLRDDEQRRDRLHCSDRPAHPQRAVGYDGPRNATCSRCP